MIPELTRLLDLCQENPTGPVSLEIFLESLSAVPSLTKASDFPMELLACFKHLYHFLEVVFFRT